MTVLYCWAYHINMTIFHYCCSLTIHVFVCLQTCTPCRYISNWCRLAEAELRSNEYFCNHMHCMHPDWKLLSSWAIQRIVLLANGANSLWMTVVYYWVYHINMYYSGKHWLYFTTAILSLHVCVSVCKPVLHAGKSQIDAGWLRQSYEATSTLLL